MNTATLFGVCGAALVGLGLYGMISQATPLRKLLAFNILGGGVFLLFGIVAQRGAAAGFGADPVPQAMVITGIVVAFAATALAIALMLRLAEKTGDTAPPPTHTAATDVIARSEATAGLDPAKQSPSGRDAAPSQARDCFVPPRSARGPRNDTRMAVSRFSDPRY